MIRPIVVLWLAPNLAFWSWYYLSLNDISFGYPFLSRDLHDFVFAVYASLLGVDPALLAGMAVKGFWLDGGLILSLVAFRKRKVLAAILRSAWKRGDQRTSPAAKAESLSSAP